MKPTVSLYTVVHTFQMLNNPIVSNSTAMVAATTITTLDIDIVASRCHRLFSDKAGHALKVTLTVT